MADHAKISVIIPALNAEERLPYLISSLLEQTIPPFEILVVDSDSNDATVQVASSFPEVRVKSIDRASFNHGTTRHEALIETTGDYVCFLTDDAIPATTKLLEELARPLLDPRVALVTGRQLPKTNARRFEQLIREFNYPAESNVRSWKDLEAYGVKTFFASDVCSLYRRSSYFAVGGFMPVNTNEDMQIAASLLKGGYKIAYAANAEVFHSHNLSPRQQYERNKAIGFFMGTHQNILEGVNATNEGVRLIKTVSQKLIQEGSLIELFAFGIDCIARFLGNKAGEKEARRRS